ncbi:MAG TPA: hypothetical protein ENN41_06730 [Sediminispirochaeta sp.]|nr:hypothetical protein [Sediminispirochaeta sp.]
MKVLHIKDIQKKNVPLHYRNEFKGSAMLEFSPQRREEAPIEFSVEHQATGEVDISARVLNKINYPLVPVLKSLKEYIRTLEREGKLR